MLFAPTSFWNQRLPGSASIDPNSASYVANLLAQGEAAEYGINFRDYAKTVFFASEGDPTVAFTVDQPQPLNEYFAQMQEMVSAVPMPPQARPVGPWPTGDNHMIVVVNRKDGKRDLYEFWRARKWEIDGPATKTQGEVAAETLNKAGWHCQTAMAIKDVGASAGVFDDTSYPGIAGSRKYSAAASGLPLLGGLITVAEAQRGYIPHAVTFTAIHTEIAQTPNYRWPATKTDGISEKALAVQQGMIFTVPSSLDIAALFTDPFLRACAYAIRDFGAIVNDGSGTTVALNAEATYTIPNSQATVNDAWKGSENKFGGAGAVFSKFVGGAGGLIEQLFTTLGPYLQVVDASYRPSSIAPGMLPVGG